MRRKVLWAWYYDDLQINLDIILSCLFFKVEMSRPWQMMVHQYCLKQPEEVIQTAQHFFWNTEEVAMCLIRQDCFPYTKQLMRAITCEYEFGLHVFFKRQRGSRSYLKNMMLNVQMQRSFIFQKCQCFVNLNQLVLFQNAESKMQSILL